MEGKKGLTSPSVKEEAPASDDQEEAKPQELQGAAATKYRAIVARANFLSIDRPDIQYAVKEASRCMAKPTEGDWPKLDRIARYLVLKPRAVTHYPWRAQIGEIATYTDSDLSLIHI